MSCAVGEASGSPYIVPADGEVFALIVFARFKDDRARSWNDGWPIDPNAERKDALPAWADSLVEDLDSEEAPQIEGSLTHYLHLMSRGKLRFEGAVYESVVVLDETIGEYAGFGGGGRYKAVNDVLDSVAVFGYDFEPHANNASNVIDYACVVFRGVRSWDTCSTWTARLNAEGANGETGAGNWNRTVGGGTYQSKAWLTSWVIGQGSRVPASEYPASQTGTISCASCDSCPVVNHSLANIVATSSHEIGHSLCQNSEFLGTADHIVGMGDWGPTTGIGGGVSQAVVRYYLGWLDPTVISNNSPASDVTLFDCVAHDAPDFDRNDSLCVKIETSDPDEFFILENRRASSIYTQQFNVSYEWDVGGQPGSGLLITHVNEAGEEWHSPPTEEHWKPFNVEVASGLWDSEFEPEPESGRSAITKPYGKGGRPWGSHATDVFRPGVNTVFAPYTCPSTNLYGGGEQDSVQNVVSGLSVQNIRFGADSTIVFDVLWSQSPDSTTGNVEWDGQVILTDDFRVASGDTVTATKDAVVLLRGAGSLQSEGVDTRRIELDIDGYLDLDAWVTDCPAFASSRYTSLRMGPYAHPDSLPEEVSAGLADWYGFRLSDIGKLGIEAATIRHARAALAMETDEVPRISNIEGSHLLTFSDNLTKLSFDRDVVVPAESTLVVPNNFTIGFLPNDDNANQGSYADLCELIVFGNLDFNGQDFYNRVVFMSNEADSAESYRKGDWAGAKLHPYGSCGSGRELDFTMFRDAVHGIAVQDTCLMKMNWPLFSNNLSSDVFLDRDVRIPEGRRIDVRAPTRFVATADTSIYDHLGGETNRVDVVVDGDFVMRRPDVVSPSDWVVFESTAKDSANGDDYGGIVVMDPGMGHIEDADLGYAIRPVYFAGADSGAVLESKIHHYDEEAILDWATHSRIEGNEIERGDGADPDDQTNSGIHLVFSAAHVTGNTIGQHHDYGIWFEGAESFCTAALIPYTPVTTLRIEENVLTGDGENEQIAGSAGIYFEWLCKYFAAVVRADTVTQWSGRAMHIHQCADVDMECNHFVNSRVGFRYFRDQAKLDSTNEGDTWLTQNELKKSEANNLVVDATVGLQLYDRSGGGTLAEKNSFQEDSSTDVNVLLAFDYDDFVDLGGSAWLDTTGTVMTDSVAIISTIVTGIGEVALSPIRSSEDLCGGGSALHSPTAVQAHDPPIAMSPMKPIGDALPSAWRLGTPRPNPMRGAVSLEFDVPRGQAGPVSLDVYDVSGRRVASLHRGQVAPGRYEASWRGLDDSGKRVSPGVYFVRFSSGDYSDTHKLVVLN